MKQLLAVLSLLSLSALPVFCQAETGNARRLQSVPICAPLTTTNNFILTYVAADGCWESLANGGASGSVTTSGLTTNVLPKATSASNLADSSVTDNGTIVSSGLSFSIKNNALVVEAPNSGSPGTEVNKLAKIASNSASVLTTSAADQISAYGCVIGGAGTTGSAQIVWLGNGSCYFDNVAITGGDFVVPSSTVAGTLSDAGSNLSTIVGEVMGTVTASHAACGSPPCGPYTVNFGSPDILFPGGGGPNGNGGGGGNGGGAKQQSHTFECVAGSAGGTTVLTTGDFNCYAPNGPFAGTIVGWQIAGNAASLATCSATVDIWKRNSTSAYPTSSQKISASAPVTLTTAISATGNKSSVSTWTTAVAAGDTWNANLATVTGCVYVNLSVYYQ